MFGLNWIELLVIAAVIVIVIAVLGKRNKTVQDKLLEYLPDEGDQLLLKLQSHIPEKAELREKARAVLDKAEAAAEAQAKAYLEKRGYTVTKQP